MTVKKWWKIEMKGDETTATTNGASMCFGWSEQ